jgi:hypothetical protein
MRDFKAITGVSPSPRRCVLIHGNFAGQTHARGVLAKFRVASGACVAGNEGADAGLDLKAGASGTVVRTSRRASHRTMSPHLW